MGQFGAGGSVFGATAAAEPGNFHVLLSHVATLELSGVPKKSEGKMAGRGAAAGRARAMFGRDEEVRWTRVVVGGGMGVEYPRYAVEPRVALRLPPPRSAPARRPVRDAEG